MRRRAWQNMVARSSQRTSELFLVSCSCYTAGRVAQQSVWRDCQRKRFISPSSKLQGLTTLYSQWCTRTFGHLWPVRRILSPFFELLRFSGPRRFESIATSKVHYFLFMCGSLAHALTHHFPQGVSSKKKCCNLRWATYLAKTDHFKWTIFFLLESLLLEFFWRSCSRLVLCMSESNCVHLCSPLQSSGVYPSLLGFVLLIRSAQAMTTCSPIILRLLLTVPPSALSRTRMENSIVCCSRASPVTGIIFGPLTTAQTPVV
jgi:hypothetical protein